MANSESGIEDRHQEALLLKAQAEQRFHSSNLKSALKYAKKAYCLCPTVDGVSEMLTAYRVLLAAGESKSNGPASLSSQPQPEWYKILGLEPFCHINSIKKQYKQLALTLHPDKNTLEASNEAFKLVNDAFQVLSDKIRRKEYDMKLRIAMQEEVVEGLAVVQAEEEEIEPLRVTVAEDMFRAACSRCRLLHTFERMYVGHELVCPNCRKSFKAVGFVDGEEVQGLGARNKSTTAELLKNCSQKSKIVDERPKVVRKKRQLSGIVEELERESLKESKRRPNVDDELTLAEMQLQVRRKKKEKKEKLVKMKEDRGITNLAENGDLMAMVVEDSDFYDFDKDRVEKNLKKGQVWAIYDDSDGMPRHYALINEVSIHPFEVKISWLDLQHESDERFVNWEKMGFHITCGSFKVARKDTVNLVNIFSHTVVCERAAKEVYRIYPNKGSVWALHSESALFIEEEESSLSTTERHYDIVVFLTNYSEKYGLSMAYLEKVDGFKSVFRRRDIGAHAVRLAVKCDMRLFSHQIPARKLAGDESPALLKDCWELDPASLPAYLLQI